LAKAIASPFRNLVVSLVSFAFHLAVNVAAAVLWAVAIPVGLLFTAVESCLRPRSPKGIRLDETGSEHEKDEHDAGIQRRQREAEARA
jgi:hypothetical protein